MNSHTSKNLIAITATLFSIILVLFAAHLLIGQGILSPYEKNGLDRLELMCDNESNFISTQRYIGFSDFDITDFKSFPDLPITSKLQCGFLHVEFKRDPSLLDRTASTIYCGDKVIGTSEMESLGYSCEETISIEVYRI